MKQIPYTTDPTDGVGHRCDDYEGGIKCTRRQGHPTKTITKLKIDEESEVEIEINHRGSMGGRFFTWGV